MVHLELKSIVKDFGDFRAVDSLDLKIETGEFVSLLGASGCGKTTTLRMIAGLAKPTSGHVYLENKDITKTPSRFRNIGMVFQSYALFPTMNVFENICFGLRVRKHSNKKIESKIHELLELGHLEGLAKRYPAQLSGGQQQRVALLRALAIEPDLLLLDEPLSNLDAKLRVDIRKEIKKMQSLLNITTVYVTHDQEEALAVSDRIAVMEQGVIQQFGSPVEIYMRPSNKFVSDFIGRANFLSCEIEDKEHLRFEDELFAFPVPDNLQSNKTVYLSFRPQYVGVHGPSFVPQVDFKGLILKAKLSFEIFLGTIYQMEAETNKGNIIMIEKPLEERNYLDLDINSELLLTIPSDHIFLF